MNPARLCCGGLDAHEEWCPSHIRSALTWIEPSLDGMRLRQKAETALDALIERDGLTTRLTVTDLLPLAGYLYRDPSVGCCLHLPLATGAVDNDTIRRCIRGADAKGHRHCETLGKVMLRLTVPQRERLARDAKR